MSFLKTVESIGEEVIKDLEWVGEEIETIIEAVIVAEKQTIATQIVPLLKQAALNLQNESPGLSAKDFIPAIVAAVIPILPVALADMEHTFIFTVASTIAGQLNVTNDPGNQGNLPGGVSS